MLIEDKIEIANRVKDKVSDLKIEGVITSDNSWTINTNRITNTINILEKEYLSISFMLNLSELQSIKLNAWMNINVLNVNAEVSVNLNLIYIRNTTWKKELIRINRKIFLVIIGWARRDCA